MPDAPATVSIWTTLVPVIVGGAIGLAGGWVGPWFIERRKENAEKKKRRAEKFQELVEGLFEHRHWLYVAQNIRAYGEKRDEVVSPLAKVQAIVSVYFPNFEKDISELDLAADQYEIWMLQAAQKRVKGDTATLTDGAVEAAEPYLKKLHSLLSKLRKFAEREFQ